MDTLYSVTLLISLAAGALAIAVAVLPHFPWVRRLLPLRMQGNGNSHLRSALLILVALTSLVLSLVVHLVFGHRPGSPDALRLFEFFGVHPSFIVAGLLPAIAAALHRLPPRDR